MVVIVVMVTVVVVLGRLKGVVVGRLQHQKMLYRWWVDPIRRDGTYEEGDLDFAIVQDLFRHTAHELLNQHCSWPPSSATASILPPWAIATDP